MATDTFDIQGLVSASGVPRRTIYFYVQQGLLPPPQGAGLAAYYSPEHLLRLQLIPVLRAKGLRLDEIRQRFSEMTDEEMRRELVAAQEASREDAQAAEKKPSPPRAFLQEATAPYLPVSPPDDQESALPSPRPRVSVSPRLSPSAYPRLFHHYPLPAGITLIAPDNLSPTDRAKLEQVLQAARQILSTGLFLAEDRPGDSSDGPNRPQEV
jgi:DNA-binding transcriptional MerR regulator